MTDLTGETIAGRYRIVKPLGEGPLTADYKAYDERRFNSVVIKRLHDDLAEDVEVIKRLRELAPQLEELKHPNILAYRGLEQTRDHVFWITAYVDGLDLARCLEEADLLLSFHQAVLIFRGVASALAYAHEQTIYHGALKPADVWLEDEGQVRVTDFGLLQVFRKAMGRYPPDLDHPYLAPEVGEGAIPDVKADVYGLAALINHLLAGGPPVAEHRDDIALEALNPTVPEHVPALMDAALAREPEVRPASVPEFFEELTGRRLADHYEGDAELSGVLAARGISASSEPRSMHQAAARLVDFFKDIEAPEPDEEEAEESAGSEEEAMAELAALFEEPAVEELTVEELTVEEPAEAEASEEAPEMRSWSTSWRDLIKDAREIDALLKQAGQAMRAGEWEAVQNSCAEILERAPKNAAARTLAVEAAMAQRHARWLAQAHENIEADKDLEEGQRHLEQILAEDPTHQEARELLAQLKA
jgi:serine/threonine protein kinase